MFIQQQDSGLAGDEQAHGMVTPTMERRPGSGRMPAAWIGGESLERLTAIPHFYR